MAEAKPPEVSPVHNTPHNAARNTEDARRQADAYQRQAPTETQTHGMEREPEHTSLNEEVRARVMHQHKGDVGRPGTNEDIYQGSKQKELNP